MKKIVLFCLLLTTLLIASCAQTTTTNTNAFVGGVRGLELTFSEAAPPNEIFDNKQYPFSVIVNVENKGEYDLEDNEGYIQIEGIIGREFGVGDSDLREDIPAIQGARKNIDGTNQNGYQDVVEFATLSYQPNLPGALETTIRAQACYNYETKAATTLCVKTEVDNIKENEICQISGEKQVSNSGAPIQVKSVRENPLGDNKIQVTLTIGTVGQAGENFYKLDSECDNRRNNPDMYVVYVEVDPIVNGAIPAKCSGLNGGNKGEIKLFDGQDRTITCSFDTSDIKTDSNTNMNVKLGYRYSQFIEKGVVIRDIATDDDN